MSAERLKVVHINAGGDECGGATIAALRMHRMMLSMGIDSYFACWSNPNVEKSILLRRSAFCRLMRFCVNGILHVLFGGGQSTGLLPSGMAELVNRLSPDVVVLHWLQLDTISIREVTRLKAKRIYWYHHDLWPIRGLTAHEWYQVPHRLLWLDKIVLHNKRSCAREMGRRLVPLCSSEWVANKLRESNMYQVEPQIIHLPILGCFGCGVRRTHLRFRILYGACGGFANGIKGGDRLLSAIELIPQAEKNEMEIVVFGCNGAGESVAGISTRYVGVLHDELLSTEYKDADIFAFPSRQETYGQTKLEALACGTPVVAFDETACAEGIVHKRNGWIAPPNDIHNYAEGIRWFFHEWRGAHPVRVSDFDVSQYNSQIKDKWESLLSQVRTEN